MMEIVVTDEESGFTYRLTTCLDCGAWISDVDKHEEFHKELSDVDETQVLL